MSNIVPTPARAMSGIHRERQVRFTWHFPTSGVHAIITGELREVHHDTEGVTLWVVGERNGSATEFILDPDRLIEVGI